ncbi:MAG: 2OG-Fe(II) oxygenase [Candidatus Contendobacter sp.]|nr:2OG-Fe(II) oxygenase [Candidatus Contendobacter sp.]
MSLITTELAKALSTVQRPGDFYASGITELSAPRLTVDGVGPIALPVLPVQVQQLIAVAEQAPYGRGAETLVDTQVRRTWQIEEARVHLEGVGWTQTLTNIVTWSAASLGVTGRVAAELYKLLIYDEGSFFVSHRDTEKAPGMFATLVIVLPSIYEGGELIVRHLDREERLELRCEEPSEVAFAAFYADCMHEVLPITSGCRLTLIYNLLRRGNDPVPEPPNYANEQAQAAALLRQWAAELAQPDSDAPVKLLYCLEHVYTEAELDFDALKGADTATVAVLVDAAKQADCDVYLALVSISESGSAEYNGDYYRSRRRRWRDDDHHHDNNDQFEVGEIFDHETTISQWRGVNGKRPTWGDFPFDEQELCPPNAFDGLEPDELHFQEATGNEGASFDRTYRRAALVLWPRRQWLAVLNQPGLSATLPYLEELTEGWIASGKNPTSSLWCEAHELAGHMLQTWPLQDRGTWQDGSDSAATRMLNALTWLNDPERIVAVLSDISAAGDYGKSDNPALMQAAGLLPPVQVAELIERIMIRNGAKALAACGDLLMRCAIEARDARRTVDLIPAAIALIQAMPGDPAREPPLEQQRRRSRSEVTPGFVVDVLTALSLLDPARADRAVEYLLAWPKTYGLDEVIVPAALTLTDRAAVRDGTAVQRLRGAALAHLNTRIAEPLEPPRDWKRASAITCPCVHCTELSGFLADPACKSWTLKAAQAERSHVEESIRSNGCDVDCVTEQRGRPYGLVCTKNRASYEKRAQQRKKDLKEQARLAAG